ncbi:polysaccharide pyruvyl transferase family protein [Photobacterium sp. J15]|uniref:polysaccharide pyruvyl transferase family protein n=1 Tax=Photobacterium sp. J15 TaxID=265901 RepID=UPI0007E3DA03|nr:polysaccharide pyruvyl transferase family protein [Photobacterium sp. J15]
MNVGLITTHFTINYGAVLQGYALQKAIINLGYNCETIDYSPEGDSYGKKNKYNFSTLRGSIGSVLQLINFKYRHDLSKKRELFNEFVSKEFNLSSAKFSDYSDLKKNVSEYDVFVCGSDQIWNLNLIDDLSFFLKFDCVYPNSKYVAYAPSVSEALSDEQYDEITKRVKHFSHLSTREEDASIRLANHSNRKVENVIDPTFLLTQQDWASLAEGIKIDEPYILCFEVASDSHFSARLKELRKKLPYKLVTISTKPYNKHSADYNLTDISPYQFLGLIKNAKFVITSSFHATAFSVIFEKDFLVIPNKFRSSRHVNLLKKFDLESRILFSGDDLSNFVSLENINYENVRNKVRDIRANSLNYLENALKG